MVACTQVERQIIQDELKAKWPEQLKAAERMACTAMQTYQRPGERAALRCALGDAASLCDAAARDIENLNRGVRGHVTQQGQRLERIAKHCAEALWLMRERIIIP